VTTFAETNCTVERLAPTANRTARYYAACKAGTCTFVGPTRSTPAQAKRDAVRHHLTDWSPTS
jgi:hypothetical protein